MSGVAASGDEFECEPIYLGVPASVDAERELEMEREVLGTSVRQWAADKVPLAGCEQPLPFAQKKTYEPDPRPIKKPKKKGK